MQPDVALLAEELVEKLLAERAELEETILLMQQKLDEQNTINEAETESEALA